MARTILLLEVVRYSESGTVLLCTTIRISDEAILIG